MPSYAGDMPPFPRDDDEPHGDRPPPRRNLSDRQVEQEFAKIAEEFTPEPPPGPRDYTSFEDDEPFIPPDPGPVTGSDPFLTMGWTLLVGGLLVILASLIFWPSAPRPFHLGCTISVLIGAAILVWRMPREKEEDDDFGAVV